MSDSEDEETPVQHVNVVFVGERNVGKTSLIRRFCFEDFLRQYSPTTGADFHAKRLVLPTARAGGKQEVVLKLTDIAGAERTAHMLDKYLFKADMIVLVYDITNAESFERMLAWIDAIGALITSPPLSAVVGNKCDLEHQRAVRLDRTRQFVREHDLRGYLASAKTGEAVGACIVELVAKHLGAPMAGVQKEGAVLKAELQRGDRVADAIAKRKLHAQHTKSAVCLIQ